MPSYLVLVNVTCSMRLEIIADTEEDAEEELFSTLNRDNCFEYWHELRNFDFEVFSIELVEEEF